MEALALLIGDSVTLRLDRNLTTNLIDNHFINRLVNPPPDPPPPSFISVRYMYDQQLRRLMQAPPDNRSIDLADHTSLATALEYLHLNQIEQVKLDHMDAFQTNTVLHGWESTGRGATGILDSRTRGDGGRGGIEIKASTEVTTSALYNLVSVLEENRDQITIPIRHGRVEDERLQLAILNLCSQVIFQFLWHIMR